MYENVNSVGAGVSTEGSANEDQVLVSRKELLRLRQERDDNLKELSRLKKERDEYRAMCLDFAESVPRFHKVQENIETILANGGAK